jgi:hypothetical protein
MSRPTTRDGGAADAADAILATRDASVTDAIDALGRDVAAVRVSLRHVLRRVDILEQRMEMPTAGIGGTSTIGGTPEWIRHAQRTLRHSAMPDDADAPRPLPSVARGTQHRDRDRDVVASLHARPTLGRPAGQPF